MTLTMTIMSTVAGAILFAFGLFLVGLTVVVFAKPAVAERFFVAFASSARPHYIGANCPSTDRHVSLPMSGIYGARRPNGSTMGRRFAGAEPYPLCPIFGEELLRCCFVP